MLRIKFNNGLVLGGGDYMIESPIQGLDTPKIRNADGVWTAMDGGYMLSQYYGQRTITVQGFFFDNCYENLDAKRKFLLQHLYMRYKSPITIEDIGNNYFVTSGYITDVKAEITSITQGKYQITIQCPDPALYACSSWEDDSPTVITQNLAVNDETSMFRQGDMDARPIIILTGKFTNPIITIGENQFGLNVETTGSDKITIDMNARTVVDKDGQSIIGDRMLSSKWLYLGEGSNIITIETDDNSDSGTAKLTYSAGYRGI